MRKAKPIEPQTVAKVPEPEKVTTVLSTIVQWLFIFGIIAGVYFLFRLLSFKLPQLNLRSYEIICLAFSMSFTWVYIFKWGSIKPFNCVTCMAGWFSLIIGYLSVGWWGLAYMPIGMTVAALYSEIRMRWL